MREGPRCYLDLRPTRHRIAPHRSLQAVGAEIADEEIGGFHIPMSKTCGVDASKANSSVVQDAEKCQELRWAGP